MATRERTRPASAADGLNRSGRSGRRPAGSARAEVSGREAVKAALRSAAAELFADRAASQVSVREIAERAGVNHGLVHRHFGSKEELRREALELLADEIRDDFKQSAAGLKGQIELFEAVAKRDGYWRSLARALIDREELDAVQQRSPVIDELLKDVPDGPKGEEQRLWLAMMLSQALGWLIFEPYLARATHLDDIPSDELRARVIALTRAARPPHLAGLKKDAEDGPG